MTVDDPTPAEPHRWRRVEPGYYELLVKRNGRWVPSGTEVIATFSHTRSGHGDGWRIRRDDVKSLPGAQHRAEYATLQAAKAAAIRTLETPS